MLKYLLLSTIALAASAYPLIVVQSNLNKHDLFISADELVNRLKQQDSNKLTIINVQTSFLEDDQFQSRLLKKTEALKEFKAVLKNKQTFVTPFIEYNANKLIQELSGDQNLSITTFAVNFQNLKFIEESIRQKQQDQIILIIFSRISSNVKILEEITQQTLSKDIIAAQVEAEVEADETQENQFYNVSSNTLSGFLVFLMLFFSLYISLQCISEVQAPERFTKQNFFIGKEN